MWENSIPALPLYAVSDEIRDLIRIKVIKRVVSLLRPDLDPVDGADGEQVLLDARVLLEGLRDDDAALLVELAFGGAAADEPDVSPGLRIGLRQLRELLLIARSRSNEQQAWNALEVKVPEYAPWATHGFERMMEQYQQAQPLMDAPDGQSTQEEIDKAASALNAVINAMRPGNLPELEDLGELQQLLEQAKQMPKELKPSK